MTASGDITQLTYEQAMSELETIVNTLESNQGPLQESMTLFERGQALVQYCTALLEKAELKVRQVSGEDLDDLETGE
jgi:exodeoxyribonuclease VII small subunit